MNPVLLVSLALPGPDAAWETLQKSPVHVECTESAGVPFCRSTALFQADAKLLFYGREEDLRDKYELSGKEAIYYWWAVFDDLVRRYIQLNRPDEADFARFVTSRILEPSYNFAGIEPRDISEEGSTVTLLLFFYIAYTVWYGFAILYLFEGLGIMATKPLRKEEA